MMVRSHKGRTARNDPDVGLLPVLKSLHQHDSWDLTWSD